MKKKLDNGREKPIALHSETKEASAPLSMDESPWYAVRLFTLRLQAACEYFKQYNLETYIPMQYVDFEDRHGQRKRELRPVVRNLVFVKKTVTPAQMSTLVQESPLKMAVVRKNHDSREYCEIPPQEMREFQLMCNPEIEMRKYLSGSEARLKAGTQVKVVFGPLKGLSGKLVRQSHKYYLLKEVPGMAVMLKISRWCCKPVEKI